MNLCLPFYYLPITLIFLSSFELFELFFSILFTLSIGFLAVSLCYFLVVALGIYNQTFHYLFWINILPPHVKTEALWSSLSSLRALLLKFPYVIHLYRSNLMSCLLFKVIHILKYFKNILLFLPRYLPFLLFLLYFWWSEFILVSFSFCLENICSYFFYSSSAGDESF